MKRELVKRFFLFFKLSFVFFSRKSIMECFWDNVKKRLNSMDKPDVWLIKEANLGKTAIINGQNRHTNPAVDKAYRCAQVLRVSIEELIDGEAGAEYVRKVVRNDPRAIQVPDRIYPIVECLLLLNDTELKAILASVEVTAEGKKGTDKGTGAVECLAE